MTASSRNKAKYPMHKLLQNFLLYLWQCSNICNLLLAMVNQKIDGCHGDEFDIQERQIKFKSR